MTDDVANNANAGDPPDRVIYQSGLQFQDPVGKKITRRADGSITKEHQDAVRSGSALVRNERFLTATEAFDFRCDADNRVMGFSGTFAHDFGTDDGYHAVPNKARRDVQSLFDVSEWHTIVSPTKSFLQHREGGGMLPVDVDPKFLTDPKVFGMYPEAPMVLKTADEVLSAFLQIVPEAEGCAILVVPSSSSMIADAATGEMVFGPGGWRILVPVDEARQIPRLLETIHRRCWAKEVFRYAYVNEPGAFYPRSLADTALKAPTQPDFFAAELCDELGDGLVVSPDGVLSVNEEANQWLVASSVKLSDEDDRLAQVNIEKVRAILRPIIDSRHGPAVSNHVEELVERGVPRRTAEKAAKKRFAGGAKRGMLSGSDLIFLGSGSDGIKGGMITAGVLLTRDGLQYDGMQCLDPEDPDYDGGRPTGKIYWNGGLKPVIHSFAHGPKTWDIKHDAASLAKAIEAAAADADAISLAFAQADLDDAVEQRQLLNKAAKGLGLGNERQSLKDSIERQRARIAEYARQHSTTQDDDDATAPEGPVPFDTPLPRELFPRLGLTREGIIKVLDHVDNIEFMLKRYGLSYKYNLIRKEIVWEHPELRPGGDNADTALLSQMYSLGALNSVPDKHLSMHMVALADRNAYNPVVDHLSALQWDGTPRIAKLAAATKPGDLAIVELVLRLFLIEACAAGDHAELSRAVNPEALPSFEYCPVLVAGQGIFKTKGMRHLLPAELRCFYKEGVALSVHNRDSIVTAVTGWIVELGELGSTFRKSDIDDLKGFLSKDVDELRLPFAQAWSKYKRRTAYYATVNDPLFLADETGNRRFWAITVGTLKVGWSDSEIEQLWAEAWSLYASGTQWWPTAEENALLLANAEQYRVKTGLEQIIETHFGWGAAPAWTAGRRTAQEIYAMVYHSPGVGPLTHAATKTIGTTISRLWQDSGRVSIIDGVATIQDRNGNWVKVNANDGKNRGWLLPPERLSKAVADYKAGLGASMPGGEKSGANDDEDEDDGDGDAVAVDRVVN